MRSKRPLKICEYLAAGKAIVASDVGEVFRMVQGVGELTRPGDVGSLAAGIRKLLADDHLRRELGTRARARAEEKYNWQVTAENLLVAYKRDINRCRRVWSIGRASARKRRGAAPAAPLPQGGTSGSIVQDNLDLMGVLDGELAFIGPRLVQLDVTNNCNNDCIACWCNSPLLGDQRMSAEERRLTLPLEKIRELLDELWSLGTREIYMAGGGEPFMHPQIDEVIREIKRRGMCLYINTNFTLVDQRRAELLADLEVDHLTVSTWAGTPSVYARTHPNKTEETFTQIARTLEILRERKGGRGRPPYIKLYNVISHLNYNDVEAMVDFALEAGVESMEFTVVDVVPGYTDCLLLNEEQRHDLRRRCQRIAERIEREQLPLDLFRFDQFQRRISSRDGTTGDYDRKIINELPCTVGWTFARVLPDGNVNPCLKAHRYPLGNIYHSPFREIWSSPRQVDFRRQTNRRRKEGPLFRLIGNDPEASVGCLRGCDDLGRNEFIDQRLRALNPAERVALRIAGKALRLRGRHL